MQSVGEHQEVPKEDGAMKPVKGRKKRYRDRKLAAGRREEPKELTRGDCGYWRKLAAACKKVSRRVTMVSLQQNSDSGNLWTAAGRKVTRCTEHRRKGQDKDDVAPRSPKGLAWDNGRWRGPECKTEIKEPTTKGIERWGSRKRSHLGRRPSMRFSDGISRNM
jgi:hypothetical protein